MDVFLVDQGGRLKVLDVPVGASDLAGPERWRTIVWGSETVRSLGARFFPVLATGDQLAVAPDQVPAFLDECALLRANLELVARAADSAKPLDRSVQQISARLRNIEHACARAEQAAGGVLIW
ncbi:hypothetical protein [Kitasatospora sp. LaBMicrA B282]|uniref:hypothetical protein n=1 Tax=Kitasatospora sp. LaBMicrA B282 TaxID=3420949 RepID=UPI003D0D1A24